MKTADKIMIYDDACPMCAAYTKTFVNTGLLTNNGRQSFSNIDEHWLSKIDTVKSRHEIPLINTRNNTVLYGIDAMLEVLGSKLPVVETIGMLQPVNWFLKKLYKLISYNRRVITASAKTSARFDCTPDFNFRYRILLLVIGFCFNAFMLIPTYHQVFAHSIFGNASIEQLQMAHLALVCINLLLPLKLSSKQAIEFLGQINVIGMMYSLLMIPVILINKLFVVPFIINTSLLLAIFFFMVLEYRRRLNYADIFRYTYIVAANTIAATIFLSYLAFA